MSARKVYLPTDISLLLDPAKPLIHRDLSWLQFNDRVLAESRASAGNPGLERLKFLAISASNLDEFFMIRFGSLWRALQHSRDKQSKERHIYIRNTVLNAAAKFAIKQQESLEALALDLAFYGIHMGIRTADYETALSEQVFKEEILPKLPTIEPFSILNLKTLDHGQLGAILNGTQWFKLPMTLPAVFLKTDHDGQLYYYFLDQLLLHHLGNYLTRPSGNASEVTLIRITRDGDFTISIGHEDSESIPDVVRLGLRTRERGRPVRIQFMGEMLQVTQRDISKILKIEPEQLLHCPTTMYLSQLWTVVNSTDLQILINQRSLSKTLQYPPLKALLPEPFRNQKNLFKILDHQDLLLHHPYDSFDAYLAWINAAADDDQVISIEQTAYRMDSLSPLIESLKRAAHKKKVRVVIELRARFDEYNNLKLADELKQAGVEVTFGFGKLKLHAKVALVTRMENGRTKHYTHLSSGNYKASTARQYTDLALLTSNEIIGSDARHFFDAVTNGQIPTAFKALVPAPSQLHKRLLHLIKQETAAARSGKPSRIFAKVNALVDETVINALYEASQAGVKVDLIVRGACALIPGVRGLSEHVRVISIIDRFLEHSRIYYFQHSQALYLSSADWMPRNFFSRLELAFPILDKRIYQYITQVVIETYLRDNTKAKELTSQGTWKKKGRRPQESALRSQFFFEDLANKEYLGTPLYGVLTGINSTELA